MTTIPKQQKGNSSIPNTEGKTKSAGKKSRLLGIATTGVISVPPTMSIIEGVQMMSRYCFRRLPITDPGNKKTDLDCDYHRRNQYDWRRKLV